ncbi:Uncharacterised protein [Bacillus tequilensis]|nr:Uncharacterised protein [Bacillus tequilensis]
MKKWSAQERKFKGTIAYIKCEAKPSAARWFFYMRKKRASKRLISGRTGKIATALFLNTSRVGMQICTHEGEFDVWFQ